MAVSLTTLQRELGASAVLLSLLLSKLHHLVASFTSYLFNDHFSGKPEFGSCMLDPGGMAAKNVCMARCLS